MHEEVFGRIENPRYKGYSGDILLSARHLLGLINDILDLSKVEAGKYDLTPERARPDLFIERAVRMVKSAFDEKAVKLRLEIESEDIELAVDHRAVVQMLVNLLSNAVRFSPRGGVVRLRVFKVERGLIMAVIDNGPGIPESDRQRVLSPFEQSKRVASRLYVAEADNQGTGLGLSIVQSLAQLHGGSVSLEAAEGGGTEARIWLPEECVFEVR